jgi:dipeptidyl aminopeptidase/acylaminoacyl peptidase
VKAVLAMYPPTDLVVMGRRYANYGRFSIFSQMFDGTIADRRAEARAASPVIYASRNSPPFLIYHGDKDWLVPPEQSEILDAALRKAGVQSKLVIVKGKGHAFGLDEAQLKQVAAFFHDHL